MSKVNEYFNQAEKLFVEEQKTQIEIASLLPVSERTVRNWSKKGNWIKKRKLYIESKLSLKDKVNEFAIELMERIKSDMQSGAKISTLKLRLLDSILARALKNEGINNEQKG